MPEQDIVERLLADVMQLLQASKNAEFCDGVAVRVRDIGGLLEDLQGSIDEIERLRAERDRYRKALEAFGESGVRDRVAAKVGCNHDLLHDALQFEVSAALETDPK